MTPTLRALADLPEQTWDRPDRGRLAWKTLFAGEVTPTEAARWNEALAALNVAAGAVRAWSMRRPANRNRAQARPSPAMMPQ